MNYSEQGLALTKRFEGLRLEAYQDGAGVWTVGYGSTLPAVHPGERITDAEAEARLIADMRLAIYVVNALVKVPLTQGQFDALVDFTYNAGQGSFRSSSLLRMVNANQFDQAAQQFGLWVHAGGKVEPGLVRRRKAEMEMFMGWVMDDKDELILAQVTELRGDFNKFARDTGERVSSLESQVRHGVTGNGQPSRLQVVEKRVESLSRWRWWLVGCAAESGAVISVIAWVLELGVRR